MQDGPESTRFETLSVTYGEEPTPGDPMTGDVVSPIHLASTYALPGLDTEMSLEDLDPSQGDFVYSRLSNPTRHAVEERIGALEGGEYAYAFSSGTAAIFTFVLSVVEPGDHVVAFDDLYAGTRRMLEDVFRSRLDVDVDFVDATDVENVAAAITDSTALVWLETPTNPRMNMCDVAAIADLAHDADALLGVDNTFMSPYFQNPLALGADAVAHSTTKYLNGHSDSVGGALVTNDERVADEVEFFQTVGVGDMLAPFDSYLLLRGIKTLPMRMERHQENATTVAKYLEDHELVEAVHYPGLESHPQHDLATKQMSGYGGVLSFELAGEFADAKRFLEALTEFTLAVSLGGVESLVELPAGMTHEPLSPEEREALGITDTLVRASVGVEHVDDLLADLDRGFAAMVDGAEFEDPPTADD
ncbi:PLP-dependent transferase [Halorubellus sp. JP-L1]|uniref:trans-sulfuration enzyme family protein n=1 Tax=Halorubellus sp. JP-L1 TaxID=2715753 RepID=UPI00140D8582|nr:PLP-dependent aspartate aminotransferase family protein [Halorubellus sp. JP-L1]NHN42181.1 PLP-dependent transferase [Halorubellus sp. JP-L1]